ncbi:P-II family nitrogen regulator [Petroclostridium sp. X23]|uniref:P-II family nitrogen regulator n=1 Tax=Petroclostridium sp. X23 TaxID=3045146 RepID=UPI0024AC9AA7|nr:P-II family nitrogen regulator [Petroclostridium sp. X23]WHH57533.1 P-II family nitrogen regulator [Petroclostridium sp. X23]
MYVMFAVINDVRKVKPVINKLRELGIKGATIVDTMGGGTYCAHYSGHRPAIGSAYRTMNDAGTFNKTIISVVYCEKHVLAAMDAIEEILGGNMKKSGSGIIFTVPTVDFRGGELDRYLRDHNCL